MILQSKELREHSYVAGSEAGAAGGFAAVYVPKNLKQTVILMV